MRLGSVFSVESCWACCGFLGTHIWSPLLYALTTFGVSLGGLVVVGMEVGVEVEVEVPTRSFLSHFIETPFPPPPPTPTPPPFP